MVKGLPVRKVVFYKNGVGYFEPSGAVTGTQRVAIDFSPSQLNDVLQSLTVLDEGGGRDTGSTLAAAPNAEQRRPIRIRSGSLWPASRDNQAVAKIRPKSEFFHFMPQQTLDYSSFAGIPEPCIKERQFKEAIQPLHTYIVKRSKRVIH